MFLFVKIALVNIAIQINEMFYFLFNLFLHSHIPEKKIL